MVPECKGGNVPRRKTGKALPQTACCPCSVAQIATLGTAEKLRYLLTGGEFNAETALRLGFIQEVVAPGTERQRAIEIATLISQQAARGRGDRRERSKSRIRTAE
jgi:enoyl-CoA hydratase/carnithine racemase